MADRKLINDYENAVMNLAVSDMLEQYGRDLEEKYKDAEDIAPSPEAAEKFEKAMNKAYRSGQLRSFRKRALKFARYAVTVCAAFIVIFAASVVSVDALRFRLLEWLTDIHGSHSSLIIYNDDNAYSNMIHADYLPRGYKLTNYSADGGEIEICYNNDTVYIMLSSYPNAYALNTDNEDICSEEVYINGNAGQYQNKGSVSSIYWYKDEQSYWISTNDAMISKEELVKIAQSIN
ncbi:MAG: DUF4367 domain-containing protein [Ruminococcus sp.]|nr:DUF4367 domain-containing protein [Ruminococcus sp.]